MFIIFFIFLLSNNKDFSFFKKNRIVFLFSWSRCIFRWGLSRKQMAHSNWVKSSLKFEESLVKGLLERKGARDSAPRPEGSEPSPRCGERPVWKGSRRPSVRIDQNLPWWGLTSDEGIVSRRPLRKCSFRAEALVRIRKVCSSNELLHWVPAGGLLVTRMSPWRAEGRVSRDEDTGWEWMTPALPTGP